MIKNIEHKELIQIIDYDSLTGLFTWGEGRPKGRLLGAIAGSIEPKGYRQIRIKGKLYRAHRLAWFYVNMEWAEQIDHRDRVKDNNKIKNLRNVDNKRNHMNMPLRANNTSGFNGVSIFSGTNKFRAYITVENRQLSLGLFDTPEEAHEARKLADIEFGFDETHGY